MLDFFQDFFGVGGGEGKIGCYAIFLLFSDQILEGGKSLCKGRHTPPPPVKESQYENEAKGTFFA